MPTEPVDCWELLRIALAAAEMSGASGANCLVDALHEVLAYHERAEKIERAATCLMTIIEPMGGPYTSPKYTAAWMNLRDALVPRVEGK